MTAQRTPGPWLRDEGGGLKGDIRAANGRWVALTRLHWQTKTRDGMNAAEAEDRANADYIVECVKSHDALVAQVEKLKLDLWVVGSRFNCLAIDRPQLPAEAAFGSTSEYLRACAEIIDAHMQAAVAKAAQSLKARTA